MEALPYLSLANSAVGAFSTIKGGSDERKLYNQQAANLEYRASLSDAATAEDLRIMAIKNAKDYGAQQQSYASAGVRIDEGSPLQALQDQVREGTYNLAKRKWQGQVESSNLRYAAAFTRYQGKAVASAAFTKGMGSLLSGSLNTFTSMLTPAQPTKSTPTPASQLVPDAGSFSDPNVVNRFLVNKPGASSGWGANPSLEDSF